MDRNTKLECFAHARGFHTLPDASPKRSVEQDDIDRRIQNIRRELLEIYNDRVRREWHTNFLARPTHAVKSKHRIFQVIVVDVLDLLAEPDRLFGRPGRVRIEPKRITAS